MLGVAVAYGGVYIPLEFVVFIAATGVLDTALFS